MSISTGGGKKSAGPTARTNQLPPGCAIVFFLPFFGMGLLFFVIMTGLLISGQLPWFVAPFMLIPILFMVVGGAGIYSGFQNRGKSLEQLNVVVGTDKALPVPKGTAMPGQYMALRLRPEATQKASAAGLGCFALFWNGIVGVFVVSMASAWQRGESVPVFLPLFLTPFVLIGIGVLIAFLRSVLIMARVHDTVIEVDAEPVCPGERLRMRLSQTGPLSLNGLTASLVCEERATYSQGSSSHTDKRVVWEQQIVTTGPVEISGLNPWEQAVEADVPPDAMHSFHSLHNNIVWLVRVKAEIRRWPDYTGDFPFRVVPRGTRGLVEWP